MILKTGIGHGDIGSIF